MSNEAGERLGRWYMYAVSQGRIELTDEEFSEWQRGIEPPIKPTEEFELQSGE